MRRNSRLYSLIARSNGTLTTREEVIQAHSAWVATLAVASAVMIVASLVSPVTRIFLRRGPDLMFNISSLATRDSKHIGLPASGTYLDPSDKARLVKDLKVRFGDVRRDADIGRLAIGMLDVYGVPKVAAVQRKRQYM